MISYLDRARQTEWGGTVLIRRLDLDRNQGRVPNNWGVTWTLGWPLKPDPVGSIPTTSAKLSLRDINT